jgi:hypothetical protein
METMDHTDQDAAKQQGRTCACHKHGSGKQASGVETHAHFTEHIAIHALDILDERFARREIEKAEYAEKKRLISQRSGHEQDPPPAAARTKPGSAEQHVQRR